MKKMFLIVVAVVFIGLLAACNQDDETNSEEKDAIAPVETTKAEKGDLVIEKNMYGRTAPSSQTPIMVQAPGEISSLEVENGDTVEEGDLIATISGRNIYAPASGELTKLVAEEGSIASNTEPLAIIADFDPLTLQFSVTANDLALFEEEAKHHAVIDENEVEAEITSIGKMPNDTGLYPVEASIENKESDYLPGQVAVLHVPESRVKDSIIVPTAAIVEESDQSFIYVVNGDKAAKVKVEVTETQSDQSAIKGDVKKGDQVVISGQLTLTDGSKVNVVKEGNES